MSARYWLGTFVYCLGITYLSTQPLEMDYGVEFSGMDKLAHAAVFGGLALLMAFGMARARRPWPRRAQVAVPMGFTIAFGVFIECWQLFIPNRYFEMADIIADALGAILAVVALRFVLRRLQSPRAPSTPGSVE